MLLPAHRVVVVMLIFDGTYGIHFYKAAQNLFEVIGAGNDAEMQVHA